MTWPRWPARWPLPSISRRRVLCAAGIGVVLGSCLLWLRVAPLPAGLLDEPRPSTIVLDRHGIELYEARASDGTRGIRLRPEALPAALVAATIAAEDRRFWSHMGIDPRSIARAARANILEGAVVEGGSTITQQLAKLLLARRHPARLRGWGAKLHEALIAVRLEHRFGKREILAMYLNLANYGNQLAGAERASRAYFGVSAGMLTHAQAAYLAGLPQRPSGFNPFRNAQAAVARQRTILRRMEAAGAMTAEEGQQARAERIHPNAPRPVFTAPHFVEMVLTAAGERRPDRIETTLDVQLQQEVAGVIESHRAMLTRHGAAAVAVVVLDNRTGEWLAWEGSGSYERGDGGTINGAALPRQPGSALKPFTYALAFEQGFSPASVLADVPSTFATLEPGIVYSPRNYDGRFRGPLLARLALAGSENVPAVALASELGVPPLLRLLSRAGLSTLDRTSAHYGLGLTLGNAEVRLDELVAAYAALARGGEWLQPTYLEDSTPRPVRRLVSPRSAFWITDILSDGDARQYAFGRGGSLDFPFPVAVKTGTSQAYHDNWTIGYSRHVTVGVWVGNFDRTPLRNSSGVTGAAPVFHGVMLAAERRVAGSVDGGSAIMAAPPDSVRREICELSGMAANGWCPNRRSEWTAAESSPLPCSWHHLAHDGLHTFLPAEYRAWLGSEGARSTANPQGASPRVAAAVAVPAKSNDHGTARPPAADRFAIVSPGNGSTYLIDPTLRREFQTLALKAIVERGGSVEWSIDGRPLGTAAAGESMEWPLAPGRHRIRARDDRGRSDEAVIIVR